MNKTMQSKKKWLLTLHIIMASFLLGITFAILFLTVTALSTNDPDIMKALYQSLHVLGMAPLRVATVASIVSGAVLSILMRFGLFRFYWIIAKELLSVIAVGIGYIGIHYWTLHGISLMDAAGSGAFVEPQIMKNNADLLTGILLQLISLFAIFAISVFKPWGARRRTKKERDVIQSESSKSIRGEK